MQVVGQSLRGPVAALGIFLQALEADRLQIARHLGLKTPYRHRFLFEHLVERLERGGSAERRTAGQQLIEDGAEGVDVGRGTDGTALPGRLFGGHVAGRAHDVAGPRLARSTAKPRQAEVSDFRLKIRNPKSEIRNKSEIRIT